MSIFGFLFPRIPRDWPECRPVPLVFDLARRALNGIAARDPVDRLRELGRPANRDPLTTRIACYPPLGIEIEHDGHRVDSFTCLFQPRPAARRGRDGSAFQPCRIELWRADGGSVHVTADTTPEEIRSHFDSGRVHGDEDGTMLQVQEGDVWLYFDFGPDDRLRVLEIEPEPLFESELEPPTVEP